MRTTNCHLASTFPDPGIASDFVFFFSTHVNFVPQIKSFWVFFFPMPLQHDLYNLQLKPLFLTL